MSVNWLGPRADEHDDCPVSWFCQRCGHEICPRCEPSPAEERECADCTQEAS